MLGADYGNRRYEAVWYPASNNQANSFREIEETMQPQSQSLALSNELRQEQILAPQQIQSLEILMAPMMELEERIVQEMEANPVLELEAPGSESSSEDSTGDDEGEGSEAEEQAASLEIQDAQDAQEVYSERPEHVPEDSDEELNQLIQLAEGWQSAIPQLNPRSGSESEDEERRQRLFDSIVEEPSLQEQLLEQLRLAERDEETNKLAELIIGSIDDSGYLRSNLADLATAAEAEIHDVERALELVQSFDPPGIGARDLKECLLLQLERQGRGKSKLAQIAKRMEISLDELNELIEELRLLNPHPGAAAAPDNPIYVVPEVFVEKVGDEFKIVANDNSLPRLRISNLYLKMLEDPRTPDEAKSYIRTKLSNGKTLIKSLELRQSTIRRIAEVIVSTQHDFLENGVEHLKPLTMQQVADKLDLHETTISRAIANKYMQTPCGLFEFKYFFTGGYQGASGEEISSRGVKEMIRDLIDREDSADPVSDSKIVDLLKERGLEVARRTVAKYREELGIQSSHLRKAY